MDKLKTPPEVVKGSVNLLRIIAAETEGPYKSWEQHAIDNVLTELKRLQELERSLTHEPSI